MTLFERGEALSRLSALYAECREGQERVAVITGAVGTGKTGITRIFAKDAAADGAIYCDAVASAVERTLPFSVIGQLFMSPELPAETRKQAARLLDAAAITAQVGYSGPGHMSADNKTIAYISYRLSRLLLDVTDGTNRPLLIAVDDAHNSDHASLQCLSSIVGRLRRTRFMAVISASNGPQLFNPAFLAGLPAEPYCHYIRLDLLTEQGVESMLAERIGIDTARQLAAECHAISGGNPIMVRGLIGDYCLSAKETETQQLVIGPETIRAFLGMLHRCDSSMLSVVRWQASLGESEAPSTAGRLAGLDSESTTRTLSALDRTGCFEGGRFRHPGLCNAVLDGLAPAEQATMHARAAAFLRIEGAPVPVIADHLLAADKPQATWAVPLLNSAAEEALASGDVGRALSYLRLARRLPAQQPHSGVTQAMLARAEWRLNPALTMRQGTDLITAIQSGDPIGQDLPAWVSRLMWFGRADEAREALCVSSTREALDQAVTSQLDALRVWFSYMFPSDHATERTITAPDGGQPALATAGPVWQAISLLVRTLTDGPGESTVAAEHLIEESRLNERTFGPLGTALATLIYGGRLGTADMWCASLQEDAAAQETPTWQAVFVALRSMVALRQGDLRAAETYACTALTLIPAEGWGIGIVIPLSVLINTTTMTGRYKKAFAHLRTPVPDVLFETPLGMHYLQARGRFHYAREDFHNALHDFRSIADLMTRWDMDLPALVPWRTDAALAHLRLRRSEQAHDLVIEQLKMLGPAHARERGISLRVLAECGEPAKRLARLRQSVKELQNSDNRLELAQALADLSRAYHARGEMGQARKISRRAHQIAKQCGAAALSNTCFSSESTDSHNDETKGNDPVTLELYRDLSKAELRVAALAADGYSNRQIADNLFITISTVEQHLTKIYSKLKVSRRSDLPFLLH